MEWVKTTAKSVPEAIDLALDNLGVDEAEAEIEVLEEPKSSFLGLRTKGVARVRARVKPRPIRAKQTRDRKNQKRKGNNRGGNRRDRQPQSKGSKQQNNNGNRSSNNRRSKASSQESGRVDSKNADRTDTSRSNEDQGRKSNGGRSKAAKSSRRDQNTSEAVASVDSHQRKNPSSDPAQVAESGAKKTQSTQAKTNKRNKNQNSKKNVSAAPKSTPEQETPVEEVANHLKGFLGGLTDAFGLEGAVVIDDSEDNTLIATVEGQHGLMVGPKGRTLDAIQELARISSQRTAPSSIRIKVDVGGYRAKRNEALADFARKAADKAVDNGLEVALEPMTPADRKIVHDALTDDGRVETRSVGHEPRRKVLVVPVAGAGGDSSSEEE